MKNCRLPIADFRLPNGECDGFDVRQKARPGMRLRSGNQSAMGNRQSAIGRGFTLVELLVVIGIIVLLVGILLPVVHGVRKSAYAAASGQQIARLNAAIQAYYGDHKAYPGPLSNDQIITGAT